MPRTKKLHAVEDLNILILGEQHKQHLTDAQMAELAGITTRRYRYAKPDFTDLLMHDTILRLLKELGITLQRYNNCVDLDEEAEKNG
jgi:transposase